MHSIEKKQVNRLLKCCKTGLIAVMLTALSAVFAPDSRAEQRTDMPFSDISNSYAKDAIIRLYNLHLIEGTGGGKFEPTKALTRAELVTMIDRLFALEPVDSAIAAFGDVPRGSWYYRWVQPAVQLGIVSGVSAQAFAPGREVSRQDAATLFGRAAKQAAGASAAGTQVYQDQGEIQPYALPSVLRMTELGILQGDEGKFRPSASVTRQEAAVMMDRILQKSSWASEIRAPADMKIQLGWQYGQTTAQFENQVLQSNVNTLSPRWFFLNKTGMTMTGFDASLLDWAHKRGKKVWAMAGNRFDQQATHDMLSDAAKRQAAVTLLAGEVRNRGIDGLNLDFENVAPGDRNVFTAFVGELARELHKAGATLSVCLSPDTGTDWTDAFDYAALGQNADYIVLMAYDEHWGGGSQAGSVDSLPWVAKGLDRLLTQVPAGKVVLAMPMYTRDWTLQSNGAAASSTELTLLEQNAAVVSRGLKPSWDASTAQYVAGYSAAGKVHRIWLEDGRSLAAKTMMAEQHGIGGYAYWYMGAESPDIWPSLRNAMRFSAYAFH